MQSPVLYRKRLIPDECILLKNDVVLYCDEDVIVTKWNTIRPRKDMHHGMSCYFLKEGIKVSKFCDSDDRLVCWYCDIVTHTRDESTNTYVFTDLLADVVVSPDGFVKVLDLDELADAKESGLLSEEMLNTALRRTNWLLELIYRGEFYKLQKYINDTEVCHE